MKGDADILLLPGVGGSGEDHWQGIWARDIPRCRIVRQADWNGPEKKDWLEALSAEVQTFDGPFVLVAHSVGCALAAHWVSEHQRAEDGTVPTRLKAIMMVAPADVDSAAHTPDVVRSFAPMPLLVLPCKSVVIASDDDPYVPIARARHFASRWNSPLLEIGARGHINASSGLGDWPEGQKQLQSILAPDHTSSVPDPRHMQGTSNREEAS